MIYEVKDLTFKYPGGERTVLDRASLTLSEGEILCILGPNGAGKTTLLNCMIGLLEGESGEIRLCGKNLKDQSEKEIANIVGYVPQVHTPAFDYTVLDFVMLGRAPKIGAFGRPGARDKEICMEKLAGLGIQHLAGKSYLNISGGERQQVLIARALSQEPKVVLFDEPTAHLDYGNQHRVLSLIKSMSQEGYSVVITTHNPDHALLLGDKAAIVGKDGHIIQGSVQEVVTEENLTEVYKMKLKLMWVEELGRVASLVPGI